MVVKRHTHHEAIHSKIFPTKQIKDTIKVKVDEGLLPYQIRQDVSTVTSVHPTYSQIYHVWNTYMSEKCEHDEDPFPSPLKYVQACDGLQLLCFSRGPYYIGVSHPIAKIISSQFNIQELLIDSTFKTNSECLELFVVGGKVVREGFPLGYLLDERKT